MVSIRKKRHLALHEKYKVLYQLSRLNRQQQALESKVIVRENPQQRTFMDPFENEDEKKPVLAGQIVNVDSSSMKDVHNSQGNSIKNRKPTRRKLSENQETCMLRGVYYKNMKWQAAIKVDKKQIHLGTVASMEEAAHLYDRAAFLCGRVPNFELSDKEKQELQGLQWDEFLSMTKEAIANKKKRKREETSLRRRRAQGPIDGVEIETPNFQVETPSYNHPEPFEPRIFPKQEPLQSSFDEVHSFPQLEVSFQNAAYYQNGTPFQFMPHLQNAPFAISTNFS